MPNHPRPASGARSPAGDIIGWREWVALPDLGIGSIKGKIDTGARTSALHAFDLETFTRRGSAWARFSVHPIQRDGRLTVEAEAEILESREVKSSNGLSEKRPVIVTTVAWNGLTWSVELTLTRRDEMGFRLLLGREAVRGQFLVDPGKSFYGAEPRTPKPHLRPKQDKQRKKTNT